MQATSSNANENNPNSHKTEEDEQLSPADIRKEFYNTQWKQQRLWALRLRLSFFHLLIYYILFGILSIAVAVICYLSSASTPNVVRIDYTDCPSIPPSPTAPVQKCKDDPNNYMSLLCKCEKEVNIDDNLAKQEKVVFYYELSDFFQNIRKYKHDVDYIQLEGRAIQGASAVPPDNCRYEYFKKSATKKDQYIYPCGKVANSYFSDEFMMTPSGGGGPSNILDSNGIAWESDKRLRFKKPQIPSWNDITAYFDLPKDWHVDLKADFPRQNIQHEIHTT